MHVSVVNAMRTLVEPRIVSTNKLNNLAFHLPCEVHLCASLRKGSVVERARCGAREVLRAATLHEVTDREAASRRRHESSQLHFQSHFQPHKLFLKSSIAKRKVTSSACLNDSGVRSFSAYHLSPAIVIPQEYSEQYTTATTIRGFSQYTWRRD